MPGVRYFSRSEFCTCNGVNPYQGNREQVLMTARSSLSVREAADILGIAEQVSINEIRSRYHALVKEWHPDVSDYDSEDTHNTMIRLNDVYDIFISYCMQYKISFRFEDLRNTAETGPMDSWMERYGDDPIWGPYQSPSHRST